MRQQMGLSKADLVEQSRQSATASDQMARGTAIASAVWMKSLWIGCLTSTLMVTNFADRALPGGVGMLARNEVDSPQRAGRCELAKPEAGCASSNATQ
jgi:hypothetical protein